MNSVIDPVDFNFSTRDFEGIWNKLFSYESALRCIIFDRNNVHLPLKGI